MSDFQVKIPEFGESVTEATIASWLKNEGDTVVVDEPIAELETDKVSLELTAAESGVLSKIHHPSGAVVRVGDVVALITPGKVTQKTQSAPEKQTQPKENRVPAKQEPAAGTLPPAVAKMVAENKLDASQIQGTGKHGQLTKEDVQNHLRRKGPAPKPTTPQTEAAYPIQEAPAASHLGRPPEVKEAKEAEEVVPMTRLRQLVARRLVDAQQTAAILTTFNEVDMKAVMDIRSKYKDKFLDKYGVKPGFMSFFTKASIEALKAFPAINAEIRGTDIVYKKHFHIGIAVGGPKGLVVPVVKHADRHSLAGIELEIARLVSQLKNSTLPVSALEGGTFTISNGGVYGSMLSTPILNPPQTGILGMHNIIQRPVAHNGEIVIRPIMYLALSYDHRMVDGKEAVQFLVKIKETIEDPMRLVLEV